MYLTNPLARMMLLLFTFAATASAAGCEEDVSRDFPFGKCYMVGSERRQSTVYPDKPTSGG